MGDLAKCPLQTLIDQFRKTAENSLDKNDFLQGMVFNIIALRFEELQGVLRLCKDEDVYHAWQEFNGTTESEVRELLGGD